MPLAGSNGIQDSIASGAPLLNKQSKGKKVANPNLLEFPKITDERGSLTFVEELKHIPFKIQRVYYLYDISGDAARGAHAHRKLQQVMISLSGSFKVTLDDGSSKSTYHLQRPNQGLIIETFVWHEMSCFSAGAVCLMLASAPYDESDYIRDYESFLNAVNRGIA